MYDLNERFKAVRKKMGVTQKQVAEGLGMSEQQYQQYEYDVTPSAQVLCRLADFYKISLDELVGRVCHE